ncbi:Transthyretin-like family protein [Ancylostoma duodenale]|uniref:Transthyretin-like family protein n=1 Tax=Ancylostoma duodenale TaxID=51022 RepID=A0A0C2H8U0_9BILA|nr:Transthyretin-like family protein [Ancylostoma duodenale]
MLERSPGVNTVVNAKVQELFVMWLPLQLRISVPLQLAETKPNSSGDFTVAWSGSNLVPITPIVNIYHRCHYQRPIKICARVLSIQVPKDYVINNANGPNATYDVGTVNLNIKYTFELIDCIFGAYSS